jgi:hypothetical protein
MAAHAAYSGPVAVLEGPPPAVGATRSAAEGANEVPSADDADAPAPDDDDDDDDEGGVWDTASLYEEILDEVEAFEYSGNGEPARPPLRRCVWQLTTAQASRHAPPKRRAPCASDSTRSAPASLCSRTSRARR